MERWTKFYKAYLIIALFAVFVGLLAVLFLIGEASRANIDLEAARSKLENVIENQREEAKLDPENTAFKRLDFLDIVEKEKEYNQAFVHMVNAEFSKATYIALIAFIIAIISLLVPLFKKDKSKKVIEGEAISASQWPANIAVLLAVTSLLVALFKKDESKK